MTSHCFNFKLACVECDASPETEPVAKNRRIETSGEFFIRIYLEDINVSHLDHSTKA